MFELTDQRPGTCSTLPERRPALSSACRSSRGDAVVRHAWRPRCAWLRGRAGARRQLSWLSLGWMSARGCRRSRRRPRSNSLSLLIWARVARSLMASRRSTIICASPVAHPLGHQRADRPALGRRLVPAARARTSSTSRSTALLNGQRRPRQRRRHRRHRLGDRAHAAARLGQAASRPAARLRRHRRRRHTEPPRRRPGRRRAHRADRRRRRARDPRSDRRRSSSRRSRQGMHRARRGEDDRDRPFGLAARGRKLFVLHQRIPYPGRSS